MYHVAIFISNIPEMSDKAKGEDYRIQIVNLLERKTARVDEYLELLIESDMRCMPPRAITWESKKQTPDHKSATECHPGRAGGKRTQTRTTTTATRDPRLTKKRKGTKEETHTQGKTRQGPHPKIEKLQMNVVQADQTRVIVRQQQLIRKKALEGRNQKKRTIQALMMKVLTYIDRLIHERQEEDWYTDKYWGLIPDKVRKAEQIYREYNTMLAEFLATDGTKPRHHRIHLQTCILCKEIILGRGNKKTSMAHHMHNTHWTEL